jgi:CheY-like chemotaxis protein/tRNA A-37 threonylcarbamoyl transferase component Bud32
LARILHVDDDESWRQLIKRRLGDHYIDSAGSLQEAIGLLQTESPYDVALVDLNLAGDSDREGGDLLDLMQIRYPFTRRILVTGRPPGGPMRKNLFDRYDVVDILIKGDMDITDLRRVVEEAIAQDAGGPSQSLDRLSGTVREMEVASSLGSSRDLPEPDPSELRSSAGAKAAEYAVGNVIDGRFEILEILGHGAFSKVYRVSDEVEGEERALKLFDSAYGYAAVRREISALRKIHHSNVVKVFWADKTNEGDWYLVTEFIKGESLNDFVTGQKRLRDREAVDVTLDLLDALAAFHPDAARLRQLDAKSREGGLSEAELHEREELQGKGLVHRDIKPLNVILTRTGAKLLDFNIASRVGDPVRTQSGTRPYQPPDADLTRWDVSTDLFAVGVLLYQLLCDGRHPFENAMPTLGQPVTDPRTIRPDLGPEVAEFLIKACAPAKDDRFATASEMRQALRNVRADL